MAREWTRCSVADLIRLDQLIVGDGYRAKNDELSAQGIGYKLSEKDGCQVWRVRDFAP